MSQHAIVIGDDFPFTARGVHWERDSALKPGATLTWSLKDEAETVIATGPMSVYDVINANFSGVVPKATTAGLTPKRPYFLDVIMVDSGVQTTLSLALLSETRRIKR